MKTCEVSKINKQKFLAELGKLLTFMYEEDRATAIAMYEKMFDEAPDEEALLSALVSPTRQAVMIARSYDSKDRKLSVHSTEGNEAAGVAGEEPAQFISCINDIFNEVMDSQPEPVVLKDQISMFPSEEEAEPEKASEGPALVEPDVDAFIKEFTIVNDDLDKNLEPEPEKEEPAAEVQEPVEPEKSEPAEEPEPVKEEANLEPEKAVPVKEAAPEDGKLSGGALVLFLLIAIPLTALGVIALLLLAAIFFGLAAGTLYLGWNALKAAFASFTVFSDVLVILGIAIMILAIGVLFLWTAIWFIFGGIKGLVKGIIDLATKICSKKEKAK